MNRAIGPSLTNRLFMALLPAVLAACGDGESVNSAPPAAATAVEIAFSGVTAPGPVAAFSAADVASVRITAGGTAVLDTTFAFTPTDRLQLVFSIPRNEQAATITLGLRRGASPLFRGAGTVALLQGDTTSVTIQLEPIPARVDLQDQVPVFTAIGDMLALEAAAMFATGDTIPEPRLQWSSANEMIATVTSDGRVVSRGEGATWVRVQADAARDSVRIEVAAVVAAVVVTSPMARIPVETRIQLRASAHDRNGNALDRTLDWSSSNPAVATVDGTGLVSATGVGTAMISAAAGGVSGSAEITVHPPLGQWTSLRPMPQERTEISAATDGQGIYVIGGFALDGSRVVAPRAMYVCDPATDAWTTSPDSIPEGVNHAGFVYLDGKLYIVGGFRGASFDPINAVRIYDIETETWTDGPPMPTARGAMAVTVLNGKIHAIGGNALNAPALNPGEHNVGPDASSVGTHEVFDPATGQWTRLPPMPTARNHAGAAVLNGRIHVFAGRVGSNDTLAVHEVFDPATNAWTTAPRVPTGRSGIAVVAFGGKAYVFGGEKFATVEATFREAERYDPAANVWELMPPMPTGRHGLGAAVVGDFIYVIAGGPMPSFTYSSVNERLTVTIP